jgi:hypothetical protein
MSEETTTPEVGSGNDNPITIDDATSAFEGMLSTPEDSKEQPTETEEDTQEAEVEETEVEEEAEPEVEQAEETTEDDSEIEEDEEVVEEEQTFTVKAAGEEKEVTLDELKKSYQLGSDYTKKTQEIAEQRKAIEANAKDILEARKVRDEYAHKLSIIEAQLNTGLTELNSEELELLKENDPVGYTTKVSDMILQKNKLQKNTS